MSDNCKDKSVNEQEIGFVRWFAKNQGSKMPAVMDFTLKELDDFLKCSAQKKSGVPIDVCIKNHCFDLLKLTFEQSSEYHDDSPQKATWSINIQCFLSRMRTAIRKSEISCLYNTPSYKSLLRVVMMVIKELICVGITCSDQTFEDSVFFLKEMAEWELKKTPETPTDSGRSEVKVEKKLAIEVEKLSVQQILGLLLFNVVVVLQKCDSVAVRNLFPPRPFHSDLLNSALKLCAEKDWCKLKDLILPLMGDKKGNFLS